MKFAIGHARLLAIDREKISMNMIDVWNRVERIDFFHYQTFIPREPLHAKKDTLNLKKPLIGVESEVSNLSIQQNKRLGVKIVLRDGR